MATRLELHWVVRSAPCAGEDACGDACRVIRRPDAAVIVVVDGLGHGRLARNAALRALDGVSSVADEDPSLEALFDAAHASARSTRGVAMSVAKVSDTGCLAWAAVGNVDGLVVAAGGRQRIFLSGGVVGYRMPRVRPREVELAAGDLLLLATDGVGTALADDPVLAAPGVALDEAADVLFPRFRRESDDALLFLARLEVAPGDRD